MKQKRAYNREFKLEAMRLVETSGKSVSEIERDLGITPGLLHKWRRRYRVTEESTGQPVLEPSELEAAQAEIRRLRRELEVTRQEREILKAAVAIFSHDPKRSMSSWRLNASTLR